MNRSGEEQEKLLALLEEEAKRTSANKPPKDQRESRSSPLSKCLSHTLCSLRKGILHVYTKECFHISHTTLF